MSVEATYGTIDQVFEREVHALEGMLRVLRFAIPSASMQQAINLVKERGPPPPVDSSSDDGSSDSGDGAPPPPVCAPDHVSAAEWPRRGEAQLSGVDRCMH